MKTKTITPFLLISLFFTVFAPLAKSQTQSAGNFSLMFRTGDYHTTENIQEFIGDFNTKEHTDVLYRIIQFNEIPNRLTRDLLASEGIILYDYIPNMSYYAAINPGANPAVLQQYKARAVLEIQPAYKLDLTLFTQDYPEYALREGNRIELFVHHFLTVEQSQLTSQFAARNIHLVENGFTSGYMLVSAPIEEISWLAAQDYIQFIEPIYPPSEPENGTATTLHRSTSINSAHSLGRKYNGSGVNVMLQDDGIVGPHIDYQGRIGQQYVSYNSGDHGDHIAGTIMGSGNLDPKAQGMAPASTLYVYGASGYQGFNLLANHYSLPGIRITSTSYSNGCNAGYTSLARTMDQQSRLMPALMHVFSAGNDGTSNCGYGAGSGWGNITGGHKAGKNVFAVGNVNLTDGLSNSSSRGPAHDGRIKPEIVAKGSSVNSTTNPNLYTLKSGTSMACPGISGVLAQLYQAHRLNNEGADPNGGLMKAILMNTADDLGNAGPDFRFGFGRVNALRAAKTIEEYRYDSTQIEQGEVITHLLEVPEDLHELRIMLYWTDYEASIGASKALVNNLNLVVTDPEEEAFLPWILDHTPNPVNLNTPAVRGVDSINNVEQVTIKNPLSGTYEISITGHLIPQGPQPYFFTWEFITPGLMITYPFGGESFAPGETEMIRWDASDSDEPFTLEYSLDNGATWTLIAENISSVQRYYNWIVPVAATHEAIVRISRGDQSATGDFPFNIIGVPANLNIDWSCQTSFRLTWEPVYGASQYIVRILGEKYMDSIAVTPLTSYIFSDVTTAETWVSVQAISDDGIVGRRANSLRKTAGMFNCQQADLTMEDITSTAWRVYHTCSDLTEFPVAVSIRNIAADSIDNFTAGFNVNGSEDISEFQGIILPPDSSAMVQFTTLIDLSEPGEHILKVWVNHPDDTNNNNDTITQVIRVLDGDAIVPYPYYSQDFEDFERCMTWPTCEQYSCPIGDEWVNLINNSEDQIDWRTHGGNTPSVGTGPSVDHTTGTAEGNYLYLEASVLCFNREGLLLSPCFDFTAADAAALSFWYHMWGVNTGRLHVDAFMNNMIYLDIIPPLISDQGNDWQQAIIPLNEFLGNKVNFRFRGVTGPDQLSDIAIDDIEISMLTGMPGMNVLSMNMNIFPNPNTGVFTLAINDPNPGQLAVTITDLMGKTVYETMLQTNGLPLTRQIDLSNLPSGVYFLVAGNSAGQTQRKLIKQ
ncbi:MAG: S8 family serine peptidase [Bacteroidales bacterium]|nr:S8 family serine peptidase [Bacteroidales bacterium]